MSVEESIGNAVGLGITAGIGLAVLKTTANVLNDIPKKRKKKVNFQDPFLFRGQY